MKKSALISLATFLLTCLFTSVQAAEDQIVVEDLTPAQLRAEIDKIQKEFYRVFNAKNGDDDLDITCHDLVPTGSNRRREVCEPQFMIDRRSRNAVDSRAGNDALLSPQGLRSELEPEFKALTEAMNLLVQEDQYFRELNAILGMLRERLEEITN